MKRHIPIILDTLAAVALALWLGGLAALWLAVAPATHGAPAQAAGPAIAAESLRRFSGLVESSGVGLVALQWVLRRRYQAVQSLFVADGVRTLLLFVAFFGAEYGRYVLVPTLIKTHSEAAYLTLQVLAVVQAALLVAYAGVTTWLQSSRTAAPVQQAPAAPRPAAAPQRAPAPAASQKRRR